MLRNLLKISLRSFRKDKGYSLINVLGLTIGITCSLFLLLYILDELSYDRYNTNAEDIYRVVSNIKEPDNAFTWASSQLPLAAELKDNYPEIVSTVRFQGLDKILFKYGEKEFLEDNFMYSDSTVFKIFSYEFVAGDRTTALVAPHSIVLTESVAKKYFANPTDGLNQSIQSGAGETYKITGIIKDIPRNSHLRFNALISFSSIPNEPDSWGSFNPVTYVQLPPGYGLSKMQAALDKVVEKKVNPIFEKAGVKVKYGMQRITDIHLRSKIQDESESGGDISYIYIFSAVAGFMLLIACINYMNLATARSANRSREVGIRKVAGSQRKQLVAQFLIESLAVAALSLVISLVLIYLLLPFFNTLSSKAIPFSVILQPRVLGALIGIVVFTGVMGGSYPAFYLSSFNPVSVLKGKVSARGGSLFFRRSLVVIQFGLSIFMLISTLVVFDQLQYLRTTDLGFNREHVVKIQLTEGELGTNARILKDKLETRSDIAAVSLAQASPGEGIGKGLFEVEDADGKMVQRGVDLFDADDDFVQTMGMKIVEGRNFSRDIAGDSIHAVLVNESMVKRMAWKDPIGKRCEGGQRFRKQVVGVIRDYHQNSLYDEIEPLMIVLGSRFNSNVLVRISPADVPRVMKEIESTWKEVFPHDPFNYTFLDADFDSQYKADQKRSQIFTTFSALTVFIACLGLLGLAAFTTEQRTAEIGIRKVIGANVSGLVVLISKEFFVLVGIGMVLAFPASWYFTSGWLQNFAYRIELKGEWSIFVLSTLLAFLITLVTVGYHVIRSAKSNPIRALRSE